MVSIREIIKIRKRISIIDAEKRELEIQIERKIFTGYNNEDILFKYLQGWGLNKDMKWVKEKDYDLELQDFIINCINDFEKLRIKFNKNENN